MPRRSLSRRQFLATSTAAAIGAAALGAPAIGRGGNANSRINLAFIGVGGRGGANLKEMARTAEENVVALCDVNGNNLDAMGARYPQARKYRDFRKLFDETKDIDAVVVSTCEHTHAYATLPALQLGKPVYCEKPLTLNVAEARIVAQAAAKAKVPTQMGTQLHASANYHRIVELIQTGAIGKVSEAHVWVGRAWGRQSKEDSDANKDIVFVTERPTEVQQPPPYLDWDLWIGPAPMRPYHEVYFPGPKWYRWWDFGNGTMSDLGSHWNDLPYWALKLDAPKTIEAIGPEPHPEIAPASMTAIYEYGPRDSGSGLRGDLPACKLTWYQGTHKPPLWKENSTVQGFDSGVLFIGENGKMLVADYNRHLLLPEAEFKDFQRPEPFIADSPGQQLEWLAAIRNGTPTGSPFDTYAGLLTEANHLGNVAYRAGQKIEWDSKNMRVTNTRAADQYLSREPREGWKLA